MTENKFIVIAIIAIILSSCKSEESISVNPNGVRAEDILNEVNTVRTNPNKYIAILENMKQYYKGYAYQEPGDLYPRTTYEGVDAVNEAIADLKTYSVLKPLVLSTGLTQACIDHVKDNGPIGFISHNGYSGSSFFQRISRYGKLSGICSENISYGCNTARKIVLQFIIDDGVDTRLNRMNLMGSQFTKLGVGYGYHKVYQNMCVLNFAAVYIENK